MVKQASADGFRSGVEGSGTKWQDRVQEAADEGRYGTGNRGQERYAQRVTSGDSQAKYKRNVAKAFGLNEDDIDVQPSDGIDSAEEAASDWASGVSGASQRWADGVRETSASDWEEATAGQADEWYSSTKAGLQNE